MGFQIGIHAIGDKANTWILNAFEKAIEVNGKRDSRIAVNMRKFLSMMIFPICRTGVIASMQPTHCITDKRFCEKRIGYERSKVPMPGGVYWMQVLRLLLERLSC